LPLPISVVCFFAISVRVRFPGCPPSGQYFLPPLRPFGFFAIAGPPNTKARRLPGGAFHCVENAVL
jgi:hypothetical protein